MDMKKKGGKKRQKRKKRPQNNRSMVIGGVSGEKDSSLQQKAIPIKRDLDKGSFFDRTIKRYMSIGVQFLREARLELKKVKWPTRKELLASTAMVILLVLVVAFFLGLIDFGVIKIIKNIIG